MQHTGMIVSYIGTEAPEGWLFCDGSDVPEGEQYDALRTMTGGKLPGLFGSTASSTSQSWTRGTSTGQTTGKSVTETRGVSHTTTDGGDNSESRSTNQNQTTGHTVGRSVGESVSFGESASSYSIRLIIKV